MNKQNPLSSKPVNENECVCTCHDPAHPNPLSTSHIVPCCKDMNKTHCDCGGFVSVPEMHIHGTCERCVHCMKFKKPIEVEEKDFKHNPNELWGERFDSYYEGNIEISQWNNIKSFISFLLHQRETELLEKINGLEKTKKNNGWNACKKQIISIITNE